MSIKFAGLTAASMSVGALGKLGKGENKYQYSLIMLGSLSGISLIFLGLIIYEKTRPSFKTFAKLSKDSIILNEEE